MTIRIPSLIMNRWIQISLIILLVIVGYLYYQSTHAPKAEIKSYTVIRQDLSQTVTASGNITASKSVALKFPMGGYLAWVGVKQGDAVKQWQAIASVDQTDLEKRLKKSLLAYKSQRDDFDQTTQTTYKDQVETDTIKRILDKTQNSLDSTVLDVEIASEAKRQATLVSPIDGILIKATDEFAGVNTSATTEYDIVDPTSLRFSAQVEELDIASIKTGDMAIITLDAFPGEQITSYVSDIEFTPITTTSGNTAYIANLPLKPDSRLRLEMNGDINFVVAQKNNVLSIPINAIEEKDGKQYVTVLKKDGNDTVKINEEITTGLRTDEFAEVTSGLNEGESILIP